MKLSWVSPIHRFWCPAAFPTWKSYYVVLSVKDHCRRRHVVVIVFIIVICLVMVVVIMMVVMRITAVINVSSEPSRSSQALLGPLQTPWHLLTSASNLYTVFRDGKVPEDSMNVNSCAPAGVFCGL